MQTNYSQPIFRDPFELKLKYCNINFQIHNSKTKYYKKLNPPKDKTVCGG